MNRSAVTILDGAIGTELERAGIDTVSPAWSAAALVVAPEAIAALHQCYANAGATVHTAVTFRATRRHFGNSFESAVRTAVDLARRSVPGGHQVAGSMAPMGDCYDAGPADAGAADHHRENAAILAAAGVDRLIGEAFANVEEAVVATRVAVAHNVPVWMSLTAGPRGGLMTPEQMRIGAAKIRDAGADGVGVNCVDFRIITPYVEAIRSAVDADVIVYANAGDLSRPVDPLDYAAAACRWRDAGATVIGGCCGIDAAAIAAVVNTFSQ